VRIGGEPDLSARDRRNGDPDVTRRRRTALASGLAPPAIGLAGPAAADEHRCGGPATAERAIQLDRGAGVTRVEAVACDDGTWVVEGRDIGCRDREAEIAPRTARLLDIERS
jgi:hypothetical protein